VQNDNGYRRLHNERGAVKHPRPVNLSWNTSNPKDKRSSAATLQRQRNRYEKNGGTSLLKQSHRSRSLLSVEDWPPSCFNSFSMGL
jgi:hypothetical protein